jgi:hypothetical protein
MGLVGSAFEFLNDSLQRQIVGARLTVLDHAEVMLERYPDVQLIEPTMPTKAPEAAPVEDISVADIIPITSQVDTALDAQQIRDQIDAIRSEAA